MKSPENSTPEARITVQHISFADLNEANQLGDDLLTSQDPFLGVRTDLQVCLGQLSMTLGEVAKIKDQQVLVLDQPVHREIDLKIEGKTVARGILVAVGDNFAIKITKAPKLL